LSNHIVPSAVAGAILRLFLSSRGSKLSQLTAEQTRRAVNIGDQADRRFA